MRAIIIILTFSPGNETLFKASVSHGAEKLNFRGIPDLPNSSSWQTLSASKA
jgi:hypothetical protein